jgi:hypothetical protein
MEIRGAKELVASSSFLRFGTRLGLGGDSDFISGFKGRLCPAVPISIAERNQTGRQ